MRTKLVYRGGGRMQARVSIALVKVLVTGGAGFIGSHIADALLADGHDVCIFDDLSTGHERNVPDGARFVRGDLRSRDAVRSVVESFRPDVVSHQGAQTSVAVSAREPVMDAEVNVIGSLHLFDACLAADVERVVFASTGGAIYGEVPEGERATTSWIPRPLSPYACAKLSVERYLDAYRHEHGLESTVLRYANVYGPRQDPHGEAGVVAIFAKRLLGGQPIRINAMRDVGDDGCIRDYVFVDDVVRVNLEAIVGRYGADVVNVATGAPTSTRAIADGLCEALDVTPDMSFAERRAGDLERSVLEPYEGLTTVGLGTGLRRTAKWFAAQS